MKISIITVCFNSNDVIQSCLDSVQSQENVDVEHIVIDGGSTDGTLLFLQSRSNEINELISEPDEGIYHAMNKGIKIATGDIIGFLNSDDFYADNNVLSDVASTFKKNKSLEACYADLIYVSKLNLKKNIRYWKSDKYIPGSFSRGWSPPHPTFFVKSSVYKKQGGFNLNYMIASDVELMMRFLEVNKINVEYVPKLWVKMRMGGTSNNKFGNILLQNREILNALKSHGLSTNKVNFFISKIISRGLQFLRKYE